MRDYRLSELSSNEFEGLVVQICMETLGIGTVSFAEGPDGGRDGKFTGMANYYPSEADPWSGKFIIQAKGAHNPIASCSDADFSGNGKSSVLSAELPKVRKLWENGEVDNYLLFTNRKLTANTECELVKRMQSETGIANTALIGNEMITRYLDRYPSVVQACHLDRLRGPLRIHPEDIKKVILAYHDNQHMIPSDSSSRFSFSYLELRDKNKLNRLSERYFDYIKNQSESYFHSIRDFLKKPINSELAECYYDVADEFNSKILVNRDQFAAFEEIFTFLYDAIIDKMPDLRPRRLVNVFLHFMYCNCDIGEK